MGDSVSKDTAQGRPELAFAKKLVEGNCESAYGVFSDPLQAQLSVLNLRNLYEEMIAGASELPGSDPEPESRKRIEQMDKRNSLVPGPFLAIWK